ncbi:MAG: hypothetical protein MRY77_17435 [Rhodobacteraceae bacterium]|nr:hypothetical protein [Paracoccaceae bacterium]
MRSAAMVLGLIAGVVGMVVGFFGYGYTAVIEQFGEVEGLAEQVMDVETLRLVSVLAPMLALAGGGMARSRALWGGILLLLSAGGMYYGYGFNVFTMFPICFAALGGVLAVAAGRPDEEKSHF